jgi:hypothetical protein
MITALLLPSRKRPTRCVTVPSKVPITHTIFTSRGLLTGGAATKVKAKILIGTGALLARQGNPTGTPVLVVVAVVSLRYGRAWTFGNPVPDFVLLPGLALVLSALVDTEGTARERSFDPMPACEMTSNSPAEPVLEAPSWTALSFCRACGNSKGEHDDGGERYLPHQYDLF